MPTIRDREARFDIPDGEVFIHLAGRPDLVWDMAGHSQQAGARALLWQRHGGANQRWRVTIFDDENQFYTWFRITNVHSGMALVHQADGDVFVQQPLAQDGWSQVWAMGYPGFAGSSYEPARPAQPHPTGSDGIRVRFKGDYRSGGEVAGATPETSGTKLSSAPWNAFETGWKFVAA
ncbi:RICIN domain-containing protein [Streptomyces yaizuensis]|uniref:RICIN domain-containing protein n=1 Tax=Streptomyces yaizuensis TaxID=2989713 RepID=A0ABQ5P5Q2_9ACTN|nr:RICIN domain-containing protein [Streptomyces sp. YSPA8]GLF97882.1 RICIN domain-containing protein [Streptomyces sp. YSPA8]